MQVPKRVIIKISCKGLGSNLGTNSCIKNDSKQDFMIKVPASGGCNNRKAECMPDSQKLARKKMSQRTDSCVTDDSEPDVKWKAHTSCGSSKRMAETLLDSDRPKRKKMDRGIKLKCNQILKELSMRSFSWVFNSPVDPVACNIPDYFDIITNPMDLGTIRSKLENNKYSCTEEFASDVHLTFSNAMKYNPPSHDVHTWAKCLDDMFRSRWKLLVQKWNHESSTVQQGIMQNESVRYGNDEKTENIGRRLLPAVVVHKGSVDGKPSMSSSSSGCGSCGGMRCHCGNQNKSGFCSPNNKSFRDQCPETRVDAGKKNVSIHTTTSNQDTAKKVSRTQANSSNLSVVKKDLPTNATSSNSNVAKKDMPAHAASSDSNFARKDLPAPTISSNLSVAKKGLPTLVTTSKQDVAKKDLPAHATTSNQDSHGWTRLDDQSSLEKAQRAAMLRSRFADTILKAKVSSDPKRLQEEKERLERLQREEEAKIKALLEEQQLQVRKQIEKARQDSMSALELMKRRCMIDCNLMSLNELEKLCGIPLSNERSYNHYADSLRRHLWSIGLVLKGDDFVGDEDAYLYGDREEGEI